MGKRKFASESRCEDVLKQPEEDSLDTGLFGTPLEQEAAPSLGPPAPSPASSNQVTQVAVESLSSGRVAIHEGGRGRPRSQ